MNLGAIDSPSTSASSSQISSQSSSETEFEKTWREETPEKNSGQNETKKNEEIPSHLDYKSTTNFNGHGKITESSA